jgi:ribosome maturation factor RimP
MVYVILCRTFEERRRIEGPQPLFFWPLPKGQSSTNANQKMISTTTIRQLAEAYLEGTPGFLVDVRVGEGNQIRVLLDNDTSTSIEDCMALHRHLESSLDREVEDFSLDVSSPGLDQPLQLHRQYVKNIGRHLQVKPLEGPKVEGELIRVDEEGIALKIREKRRIEGRKAKEWVEEELVWAFANIQSTKVVISFK